jgi:hypothetical protein
MLRKFGRSPSLDLRIRHVSRSAIPCAGFELDLPWAGQVPGYDALCYLAAGVIRDPPGDA